MVLTASLKHHFEAVGGNIVQITFEDTEIKVTGGIGGLLVTAHTLCHPLCHTFVDLLGIKQLGIGIALPCRKELKT